MKCKTIRPLKYSPKWGPELAYKPMPVGTVLDNPKAYSSVLNGDSVPHDAECAERCYRALFRGEAIGENGLTDEQLQKLETAVAEKIRRKDPVAKGIHPDDYPDFYAGKMTGYDPETGEPIPGPNAEYSGPLELP